MAYSLLRSQSDLSSVTNEMIFVVKETVKSIDPVTYPDYKYIAEVFVNSVRVGKLKAFPDPDYNYGVFDVSTILRDFVPEYGLDLSSDTVDYDVRLSYQIKFGEEYGGVEYLDVLTDSTRTCMRSYEVAPYSDTQIYPAAGLASNMPSQRTAFHSPGKTSNTFEYFLIPYYSNVTGITNLTATYKDKTGTTLNSATYDNSTYPAYKVRQVYIGNADDDTKTIVISGNVSFTINVECTKHPVFTVVWLNKFGAYDSQHFAMVSQRSVDIDRKTYEKKKYQIDNSGALTYSANQVYYGGKRTFAASAKQRYKLTSHILSDDEYAWLEELLTSTDVYIYAVGFSAFIPAVITNSNYDKKTYLNSRLDKILTLEIEYASPYNSQFL